MAYTVKKISELSGITVRTLHFYEEIGLLKPAYHGVNGYRYYGEKELLLLQQIMFLKELGFSLKQIQKVLGKSDFDQLEALNSHRKALKSEKEKITKLIKTIDKTIKHLTGKIKMPEKEFFKGFNIALVKKAKESDSYFLAEEIISKNVKKPTKSKQDLEKLGKQFYENLTNIYKEIACCIEKGLKPDSAEVQEVIAKHHAFADQIYFATKEVYKALAQLYREHLEFKKQLSIFHPKLSQFMPKAMENFANRKLS